MTKAPISVEEGRHSSAHDNATPQPGEPRGRSGASSSSTLAQTWQRHHLVFWTSLGGALILSGWLTHAAGAPHWGHALYALGYLAGGWMAAKESFDGLRSYRLDVNVLMTLAAIGAAIIGRWAEGGTLIFLFSLSNTLEHYALERTKSAVRALMDLRPAEARLQTGAGTKQVPVEDLEVGDSILIRPGEKIPADGRIVNGRTTVDRSTFTGESIPVECDVDDDVLAGTLNLSGQIAVRVSTRAADTALAAIIHRVEQAQSGRVPTNSFVQWFGQRYTIGVLAGAALFAILPPLLFDGGWRVNFYRSLTLLVVASPCALIISTPAAVLSAIGRAARRGVLFKGGSHLLSIGTIRAIAFDKTGTLTQGKAVVTDIHPLNGAGQQELLALAAAVEAASTHPLAQGIVSAAHKRAVPIPAVEEATTIPGLGAVGTVSFKGVPQRIIVGNRRMFIAEGFKIDELAEQTMQNLEFEGKTAVLIGSDRILGVIALEDPPRLLAAEISDRLRQVGARSISMLTGDHRRVAEAMAQRLGIDDVRAGLLPEEKADAVAALMREHQRVAVIGDGVNDAPALASATIGIAMGGAKNDVVLETADVVLMSDDLSRLPFAMRLSQRTRRTIIQNLTFALVVIALLLVGTFYGKIPLPLAVVGHEGSTLLVVLNSLRLLWFR